MSQQIPGGAQTLAKRRANKPTAKSQAPASSRAAGAGGSSASMLKIFNEEAQGLKVEPLVVLVFAIAFIFSVVSLHIVAKLTGKIF